MINGGLRLYNARLDIGGFVSAVRSGRTATGWSDSALLFSSFLISSVPLVAVSVPCPLHDCPYYESLYHSLCRCICVYVRVYVCVCVRALCRRVDDEISRFEKFTSGPRASRRCLLCFLRRSLPRFELLDQPYSSWELPIITSSTVAHPWPCNSRWLDIFQGKSISRHCAVSLYPGNFQWSCANWISRRVFNI